RKRKERLINKIQLYFRSNGGKSLPFDFFCNLCEREKSERMEENASKKSSARIEENEKKD
ncbi:MAG: hypothetical protein RR416_03580, partial [Clostridia bacterium]